MYGLGNRDKFVEMQARYDAMVNTLSSLLDCGIWDIEELFDSENNIEVADIVKNFVEDTGELPNWNTIYREALFDFAAKHELEVGKDIDIYTNACLDTSIYVREGLEPEIVEKLEELFNMSAYKLWEE